MTAPLDMIRGRSNVVPLTNNSGGGLVAGDVCVQDTTADEKVTTTTSAASVLKVFIAAETIANGAVGKFYESGYCPLVNVNASVTRGRFLFTHTVAKQAAENATYGAGAFGKILKSGTTPSAIIYSATAQVSGAGITRSGSTTDGHLMVWDGSNADSAKDGGTVPAGGDSGYIVLEHQATAGTGGGTINTGSWVTRPITTEVVDTQNHVSIASNQMTLDAGTYRIHVVAMTYNTLRTQLRLYNISDSAVVLNGLSGYVGAQNTAIFVTGRFTLAAQKILEIQQQVSQSSATQGMGVETGSAFTVVHETYMTIEMTRE